MPTKINSHNVFKSILSDQSEKILGIIISAIMGVFLYHAHQKEDNREEVIHRVVTQCVSTRDNIVQAIDLCMAGAPQNVEAQSMKRFELRDVLVTTATSYANLIPPSLFLESTRLTRFDFSEAVYNLCSLSREDLMLLKGRLATYCFFDILDKDFS